MNVERWGDHIRGSVREVSGLMRWPWSKPERRQSSFTDAVLLSLLQQANGTQAGSALEIAALEMAAGQYARGVLRVQS